MLQKKLQEILQKWEKESFLPGTSLLFPPLVL